MKKYKENENRELTKEEKIHFNREVFKQDIRFLAYGYALQKEKSYGFENFDLEKHKKIMKFLRKMNAVLDYAE